MFPSAKTPLKMTTEHTTVFNYTLRSNNGRLDFDKRFSNPPSITLRATGLDLPKTAACNTGAGRYTERHFMYQTYLTEPRGN